MFSWRCGVTLKDQILTQLRPISLVSEGEEGAPDRKPSEPESTSNTAHQVVQEESRATIDVKAMMQQEIDDKSKCATVITAGVRGYLVRKRAKRAARGVQGQQTLGTMSIISMQLTSLPFLSGDVLLRVCHGHHQRELKSDVEMGSASFGEEIDIGNIKSDATLEITSAKSERHQSRQTSEEAISGIAIEIGRELATMTTATVSLLKLGIKIT